MQFLYMSLFALGIVGVDQLTKYLTVTNLAQVLPKPEHIEALKRVYHLTDAQLTELPYRANAIPGLFSFIHEANEGAAWSMLEGQLWLFSLVFVFLTVAIVWVYRKKALPFTKLEWFCIAAIYGGGLGNMIDRLRLGFVVDMIKTDFIAFPIFNVADCFITCGCILLLVHLFFFNKAFWKEEKK